MHLRLNAITTMLAVLLLAIGCRCPSQHCMPSIPAVPCCCETALAASEPPDLAGMVPTCADGPCRLQPLPTPSETFCMLEAGEVQCSAAANANIANLVRLERHWASVIIECDSSYVARNTCLRRDLLALHESDIRSESAATALESFYQLAALEAREFYLDQAIKENQASLDRINQLSEAGLPADIDRGAISVALTDLKDKRLQLKFARLQLNGQLQKLLDCASCEFQFYWPHVDWKPNLDPIDVDAQIDIGLSNRTDMRALSLVLCRVDKSTLRIARGVLNIADEAVGSVEPTDGWVHHLRCICCSDHELDVRCQQLRSLYSSTEHLATAEIKNAAYKIALQQQRVQLAKDAVDDREQTLSELLAKRDVEETSIFEINRARGRLYEAQTVLIDQMATLKISHMKLRHTQGMLANECGWGATLCCEGPCDGACVRCSGGK
ncbi:hypothetical protein OAS39_08390 [Pirellulales bacterium]|nr:hypothetical protein [Pirellulales bacterium]